MKHIFSSSSSDRRKEILLILIFMVCMISTVVGVLLISKQEGKKPKPEDVKKESIFKQTKNMFISGPKVYIIDLRGVIQKQSQASYWGAPPGSTDALLSALREYIKEDEVKGIILRVNSPGGTVAATQEVVYSMKKFQKKGKRIVVLIEDICASGGYYIASQADHIVAFPGSLTGSIGVIISAINFTGLFQRYGIANNVIKSGPKKDILSYSRAMTGEERAVLQATVNDVFYQFFHAVRRGRKIPSRQLTPLADGRVFSGREAKRYRLVDSLGDLDEAIKMIKNFKEVGPNVKIVQPGLRASNWFGNIVHGRSSKIDIQSLIKGEFNSPLLYLYRL